MELVLVGSITKLQFNNVIFNILSIKVRFDYWQLYNYMVYVYLAHITSKPYIALAWLLMLINERL